MLQVRLLHGIQGGEQRPVFRPSSIAVFSLGTTTNKREA